MTDKPYWVGFYEYEDDNEYFHTIDTSSSTTIPLIGDCVVIRDTSYRVKDRVFVLDGVNMIEIGIQVTKLSYKKGKQHQPNKEEQS